MDAQSVKTVEESAHISGFDAYAYKRVKGRKRHLLVDTASASCCPTMSRRLTCTIRKEPGDSLVD
jgi:hypothetical protein